MTITATSTRTRTPNPTTAPVGAPQTAPQTQPEGLEQLTAAVERGDRLGYHRTNRGPAVTELQTALQNHGMAIDVDGKFGPQTDRFVRQFQRDNGLSPDGVVGPQTLAALQGTTGVEPGRTSGRDLPAHTLPGAPARSGSPTRGGREINGVQVGLAPRGSSEAEAYDHYARIVQAAGGELRPGERHVLGLRGIDPQTGQVHDTRARRTMEDTMVVMWQDQDGSKHVRELAGSTYPGQNASRASPDVTGDRVGDVGMIAEGNYRAVPNGNYKGMPSYHVRTMDGSGHLPGVRDTNHDGVHSDAEWAASRRRGDTISAVLFHRGNGSSVSSIGCMNAANQQAFINAVGGSGAGFGFTLVNGMRAEAR